MQVISYYQTQWTLNDLGELVVKQPKNTARAAELITSIAAQIQRPVSDLTPLELCALAEIYGTSPYPFALQLVESDYQASNALRYLLHTKQPKTQELIESFQKITINEGRLETIDESFCDRHAVLVYELDGKTFCQQGDVRIADEQTLGLYQGRPGWGNILKIKLDEVKIKALWLGPYNVDIDILLSRRRDPIAFYGNYSRHQLEDLSSLTPTEIISEIEKKKTPVYGLIRDRAIGNYLMTGLIEVINPRADYKLLQITNTEGRSFLIDLTMPGWQQFSLGISSDILPININRSHHHKGSAYDRTQVEGETSDKSVLASRASRLARTIFHINTIPTTNVPTIAIAPNLPFSLSSLNLRSCNEIGGGNDSIVYTAQTDDRTIVIKDYPIDRSSSNNPEILRRLLQAYIADTKKTQRAIEQYGLHKTVKIDRQEYSLVPVIIPQGEQILENDQPPSITVIGSPFVKGANLSDPQSIPKITIFPNQDTDFTVEAQNAKNLAVAIRNMTNDVFSLAHAACGRFFSNDPINCKLQIDPETKTLYLMITDLGGHLNSNYSDITKFDLWQKG